VAEDVRRVSPETPEPTIAVGVFSIVGALLGVVAGLFGERLVRRVGKVRCEIAGWRRVVGTPEEPEERSLEVTFWNEKEIPVAVWEMRVDFYKGGKRLELEEGAPPAFLFLVADVDSGRQKPAEPVSLPPRVPVPLKISVKAGGEGRRRARLAEADKAEFVAGIIGARDQSLELSPPWRGTDPPIHPPSGKACSRKSA
jgi:hypothetical protein